MAGVEFAALLTQLETSNCELEWNGIWYTAANAKVRLLHKLGTAGSLQSSEQCIERVASTSCMSGQPYLVRCETSTPVRGIQWLIERLRKVHASPPLCNPKGVQGRWMTKGT